ncbi:MAG: LuxR family transcriptional regulator, partial [Sinobacteraceae bacterium]|nr:LuxR family transcriptional regulator [Nevskiaceae bacterium]
RYISPDVAQKIVFCQAARMADPGEFLSQRERDVFELFVVGLDPAEISARLHLAAKEIPNYLARTKRKLGVDSIAELVRFDLCRRYAAGWNRGQREC